ncbi:MAG: 7TM-DISM domain-containing protein, partial [Caldilineaceae bacterium]|nr:7TM-DISM domain-containing protein [Caldilineaceae bacterium]
LPFQLQPGESATLYLQTYSLGGPLFVPFTIENAVTVQQEARIHLALGSALLGLLGGLLIYNLFLFTILRSRLYLYYVLFLPFTVMTAVSSGGFGSAYLYPNNTWLGNDGIGVFLGLSLAFMMLFTQEFLQTRVYRWLHRLLNFFAICGFGISIGVFFWTSRFGHQLTMAVLFLYPLVCMLMGIIALRRGNTAARFFLIGQVATWSSMIGYALLSTGVLPYHILLFESPTLGLACDSLLLSLALADRIRILQRERVAAEDQARRNLEIRGEELEELVAKRTAEIKTLHGILPICANCKKIRTDEGAWQGLEDYISQHTDAAFSHGICTDCIEQLYPGVYRSRHSKTAP